jgi:hypothetical protein
MNGATLLICYYKTVYCTVLHNFIVYVCDYHRFTYLHREIYCEMSCKKIRLHWASVMCIMNLQ